MVVEDVVTDISLFALDVVTVLVPVADEPSVFVDVSLVMEELVESTVDDEVSLVMVDDEVSLVAVGVTLEDDSVVLALVCTDDDVLVLVLSESEPSMETVSSFVESQ